MENATICWVKKVALFFGGIVYKRNPEMKIATGIYSRAMYLRNQRYVVGNAC